MMRNPRLFSAVLMTCVLLGAAALVSFGVPTSLAAQQAGGQDIFGPYEVVPNWPKPLPDTNHSHDGWTWGSTSGIYVESPDKVWVIQRGELPLPEGAAPWTPYALLDRRSTGTVSEGVPDYPQAEPRGWERRMHHVILAFDREGNLVTA